MLNNVTVFDFETTGLDPKEDRVVEMAAIRIRDGIIVSQFQTLVHQTRPIHPKAKAAHGIEESDLVNAMDETTAFKILRNIMQDSVLVAHNAAFDLAHLHYNMIRLAGKTFTNPFIDTLTICRDRFTYPHTLGDMCGRLGLTLEGAHRAFNDVIGCWEVLQAVHAKESVVGYLNRLGYVRKYGPPDWSPDYAGVYPIDLAFENRNAG